MQCSTDFIIASPTVTSHFWRIQLLGSLYNAILLLCTHAQSCVYCIQSRHARGHGHVASSHSIMSINDHASTCVSLDAFRYLAMHGLAVFFYNPVLYSGNLIIRTSFIRHLDYSDTLNSSKYINMHAQRVWPMTFWGCGHSWSRSLKAEETYPGQDWPTCIVVWTLLTMIILYRYCFKTRHHISGEKTKHYSYPDYFTYPVCQHQGCGQRGLDNRGCTCTVIAKGFMSLLVVTGVTQLCDHALNHSAVVHFPYSVHAFIYRQLKKVTQTSIKSN